MEKIKQKQTEKLGIAAMMAAAYFAFMPLSIVPLPMGISLLKLLSYAIGGYFILAFLFGKIKLKFNLSHLIMSLYIVYTVASIFFLRDENAIINIRGMLETFLVYILVTTVVYNKREQRFLMLMWIIVGLISAFMGIYGSKSIGEGGGRTTIVIFGGAEDANQFCGYFILPVALFLQSILDKNEKKIVKIIYIVGIIGSMYAVLSTGSRGGLIAVAVTGISYVILATKGFVNKLKTFIIVGLVGAIAFFVILPIMPQDVRERLTIDAVKEDKGSGRFEIWEILLKSITASDNNMLFGQGIGSTVHILIESGSGNTVAHNHWLQMWCDQGLIGVFLFTWLIFEGMRRCYKNANVITVALFGMVALAMGLTLYATFKAFWNVIMMSAINFSPDIWNRPERIDGKNEG